MHLIRAQLLNSLIAQKLMIIAQKAYDYNQTYYPAYDSAECRHLLTFDFTNVYMMVLISVKLALHRSRREE